MTIEKFTKLFFIMASSKMIDAKAEIMKVWFDLLKGFPDEKVENAFGQIIRSADGFPSVGKIIDIIEDEDSPDYEAADIWDWLTKKIDRQDFELNSGAIKETLESFGGWRVLRNMEARDEMFIRSQFIKLMAQRLEKQKAKKQIENLDLKLIG